MYEDAQDFVPRRENQKQAETLNEIKSVADVLWFSPAINIQMNKNVSHWKCLKM